MKGQRGIEAEGIERVLIEPGASIGEALRRMDETGEKVVFLADAEGRLLGLATDGDIRRWILSGKPLDRPVSEAANANPLTLPVEHTAEQARELLVTHRIDSVPVVDDDGKVVSAIWWVDLFEEEKVERAQVDAPVVIMAGGEGTRLAPFTKVLPKPLIPIGETPIIELIIERFVDHGCRRFFVSVNYKANLIRAYFKDIEHEYDIEFLQEDRPLGTAGSLSLLKGVVDEPFFVSNCDILIDADYADIMRFHRENGHLLTLVASMKRFTIPYGVCDIRAGGQLERIREKPEFDHLVSTGLYVLDPRVLADIPGDSLYHVTDLINDYVARGERVGVYPVSEKAWLDMGQWEEYRQMLARFGGQ
jgi:dTDP-glucose pyrophosphorylase